MADRDIRRVAARPDHLAVDITLRCLAAALNPSISPVQAAAELARLAGYRSEPIELALQRVSFAGRGDTAVRAELILRLAIGACRQGRATAV